MAIWKGKVENKGYVAGSIPVHLYDTLMESKCGLLQGGSLPSYRLL